MARLLPLFLLMNFSLFAQDSVMIKLQDNQTRFYRTDGVYYFNCNNLFLLDKSGEVVESPDAKQYLGILFSQNREFRFLSKEHSDAGSILYWKDTIALIEDLKRYGNYIEKRGFWNHSRETGIEEFMNPEHPNYSLFTDRLSDNYNCSWSNCLKTYSNKSNESAIYRLNLRGDVVDFDGFIFVLQTKTRKNYFTSKNNTIHFVPIKELSQKHLREKEKIKILEDDKNRQIQEKLAQQKAIDDKRKAEVYEKNRILSLKSMSEGDRVCWSQGWQNSDSWFGIKYNTENYKMNVICYVEKKVGDRYQIRVASINSSSSQWSYPILNGVQLKENTLHWIKPSDYINNAEWHFAE